MLHELFYNFMLNRPANTWIFLIMQNLNIPRQWNICTMFKYMHRSGKTFAHVQKVPNPSFNRLRPSNMSTCELLYIWVHGFKPSFKDMANNRCFEKLMWNQMSLQPPNTVRKPLLWDTVQDAQRGPWSIIKFHQAWWMFFWWQQMDKMDKVPYWMK